MTTTIESWPRPHFAAGGGDAYLLYVVYGDFSGGLKLSRSRYRCEGVPEGLDPEEYARARHPGVLDGWHQGDLARWLDESGLREAVAGAPGCMILKGTVKDPSTLDYLRDAIGVVTCALDCGGCAVFDAQTLRWFSPAAWRKTFFDPGEPLPHEHAVILASGDGDGRVWYHTRGMRKFGRPDLSCHGIPDEHAESIASLFERFIGFQAMGAVIPAGQEVRMSSLPPGMRCEPRGSVDDPDFNNVHIEVMWP